MTTAIGDALTRADEAFVHGLLVPGGITSVFQPMVRITDGRVVGYEALSRATADPALSPERWLRDAELAGLRIEVELACAAAAGAHGAPPSGALLFVNVGHTVMLDPRFDAVRATLPPHVFELTEHQPVDQYNQVLNRLQPWLAKGTLLAIDDVGSGYASMAHVLRLSPAFIKIDRSLISGIQYSRQQRSLVDALIAFSRGLHATTIAEGVESGAELDVLRDLGVDIVQGFLLGRPGAPWVQPADPARRTVIDISRDLNALRAAVNRTTHPQDAADLVTRFLAREGNVLPSVYIEGSGVLRCLSRRGQWLVQDGMPPGVGITGACFQAQTDILVADITTDERYRAALPGVVGELAVPLRVNDEVVGVLNIDTVTPLTDENVAAARTTAEILSERLSQIGHTDRRNSALHELGRRAPWVAAGSSVEEVAVRTVEATVAVTDLESAAVWMRDDGDLPRLALIGPASDCLASLSDADVRALDTLAADFTSCYSGGGALDLGFGPTQTLRERGAFAMLLAPIRDGDRRIGLLCAISGTAASLHSDTVEAVELLCLHAGSRLAAIDRLQQLQQMVYRDALTSVANRMRWDELLDDRRGARVPLGWLATLDIDRFKTINNSLGHVAGDRALRAVAAELSAAPIGRDEVFRTGGDEFAVVLPPMSTDRATALAGQLRDRAAKVLHPYGADISVGLTRVADGQYALRDAYSQADAALLVAKNDGGATIRIS